MEHRQTKWLTVVAAGALAACGGTVEGTGAGEGLSAVERAGLTTHGAEAGPGSETRADREPPPQILPTPRVAVLPHHPEPFGRDADGLVYRTRVDVTNRGAVAVRVPRVALDVEMRALDERFGCEVVSVTTKGPPVLLPGETVLLDVRSVCPEAQGPHEVVSLVELPELTGDDGLVAARTIVADADVE